MTGKKRRLISISILCAGLLLLVLGVLRGETTTVFQKATKICLECIGIG